MDLDLHANGLPLSVQKRGNERGKEQDEEEKGVILGLNFRQLRTPFKHSAKDTNNQTTITTTVITRTITICSIGERKNMAWIVINKLHTPLPNVT